MKEIKYRIFFQKNMRNCLDLGLESSLSRNIRNFYFSRFASSLLKYKKNFFGRKYQSF